jgi:histidine triad (HIT) family protein
LDCDYDILSAVISTTKKVSLHLIQDCSYDWVNLLNASDESAWQSVPHFHIHIISRKQNDDIDAWPKFAWAKEDIKTVYERIKM